MTQTVTITVSGELAAVAHKLLGPGGGQATAEVRAAVAQTHGITLPDEAFWPASPASWRCSGQVTDVPGVSVVTANDQ